jgi:hypothetical protein
MKSNGNGFEEMVAIQLNTRSWPGQAKLSAEDLGLQDDEVPEIFRLGNKRLYSPDRAPRVWAADRDINRGPSRRRHGCPALAWGATQRPRKRSPRSLVEVRSYHIPPPVTGRSPRNT